VVRGAGVRVGEITGDAVVLADGRKVASSLVAIGTPLRGPDLGLPADLLDARGFVTADACLRVGGRAEAFVAGDALELPGFPMPKTWGMARLHAECVAGNLAVSLADTPPVPLDQRRIQRQIGMSMPDIGGRTVFVRNRRPLVGGAWPLRLRYRLDRKYLRQFRSASQVPTPGRR